MKFFKNFKLNTKNNEINSIEDSENQRTVINSYDNNVQITPFKSKLKNIFNLCKNKKRIKENMLLIFTIRSVLLGILIGFILRSQTNLNTAQKQYFGFPGEIFLRMLKFIILPLIMSSLICGIANLGQANGE